MPGTQTFQQIVRDQRAALAAALRSQADHAGVSLPSDLAERLAEGAVIGGGAENEGLSLRELFSHQPPLALVAFDTPGVHDYVFRVRRPVDVAGGSHLAAALTDPDRAGVASRLLETPFPAVQEILSQEGHPSGSSVFAGGGRGCAVVSAHRAASLRTAIERLLDGVTKGDLWTVTAELPVWPDDLGPEAAASTPGGPSTSRYAAAVSVLMGRLARERSRRERFGETVEPKAPRCAACRRRRGTEIRRRVAESICVPCSVRRALGGKLKKNADEAKTFEDLVASGDRRIAVLYADGANVGAAFQEIDSMARHRALSVAVEEAFDAAVLEITSSSALRDADDTLLCQAPIRGGDDAVLILPARFAFDATSRLVRSVEAAFDLGANVLLRDAFQDAPDALREQVGRFGVGVGIAFGDAHFPIGFLVTYAEDLLKSAKRFIHAGAGEASSSPRRLRSAVDFFLLASGNPLSESIEQLRESHFRADPRDQEPGRLLTERPFSIDAFERLLEEAENLERVSPTQRFAVRQEVLRGFALSRSFWRYQHARAKPHEGWARYRADRGAEIADVDGLLWHDAEPSESGDGTWKSTRYLDALEVLDLRPKSAGSGEAEG
jgi:hypothetical protein